LRIALATPISLRSFGGAERKLVEAANILVERSHEVCIYALSYAHPGRKVKVDELMRSLKYAGIEYYEKKHHKVSADVAYVVYAPLVWRKFRLRCPLIAGLHSPLLFPTNCSLTTFTNPLLTVKRYSSFKYMAVFWLSNTIKSLDLARFDAVRALNKVFNVKHKHVYYIPEWVNSKIFRPSGKGSDFTVFFSGRHHWEKGFTVFQKVVAALKKKGLKMRFTCTGKTTELAKGMGFLNDEKLAEAYSYSHVVLYPSKMDMFSGVIAEAAACGTPVITTPIPAHVSVGLPLIYANSVKEFVEAVMQIYNMWTEHSHEYNKLAQKYRERILKYDVSEVFPTFERMLKEVVYTDQ